MLDQISIRIQGVSKNFVISNYIVTFWDNNCINIGSNFDALEFKNLKIHLKILSNYIVTFKFLY